MKNINQNHLTLLTASAEQEKKILSLVCSLYPEISLFIPILLVILASIFSFICLLSLQVAGFCCCCFVLSFVFHLFHDVSDLKSHSWSCCFNGENFA
jgi:hypothetical protein